MSEYKLLDTEKFDTFISQSTQLIRDYEDLTKRYQEAMDTLKENWKGKGANQFFDDEKVMRANLNQLANIIKTMCDRLIDCRDIFAESDHAIGEGNRNN